jgi:hypothetical protein
VWEVADAFIAPAIHNRRYRAVRARIDARYTRVTPYVAPSDGGGGTAGIALRF